MRIDQHKHGAVTVVRPEGAVVDSDADELKSRLLEVLSGSLGRFVVDASAVSRVDSRGLEVLTEVSEQVSRGGQVLRISGVSETVREVFELTELSGLFELYADVRAAVRSFL